MNVPTHGHVVTDHLRVLTFRLAHEPYAIDVRAIQELVGLSRLRPAATPALCGQLSIRGRDLPVVDLRLRAGLGPAERGPEAVVVIARLDRVGHDLRVGLLVDEVFDVIDVEGVTSTMGLAQAGRCRFIRGVTQLGERVVFVVRADRILTPDETHSLADAGVST